MVCVACIYLAQVSSAMWGSIQTLDWTTEMEYWTGITFNPKHPFFAILGLESQNHTYLQRCLLSLGQEFAQKHNVIAQ